MPEPKISLREQRLPCGCLASWRPGRGVVGEGFVIEASAFLCTHRHTQGDFVDPSLARFTEEGT